MDIYVIMSFFFEEYDLNWRWIYLDAVGGRDDATELSTAERYNPKINQWSPVVAMNSRRSGVRFTTNKQKKTGKLFIDLHYL